MSTSTTRPLHALFLDKGGAYLNPMHKDFAGGAKGDNITLSDAAMTSASPTLSTVLGSFSILDVGKRVVVAGAGTPTSGTGTVTAAAGVATFSTSQSGVVYDGSIIIVAGTAYTVSVFNGTTGATLSGAPTFGATAFTIVQNLTTTISALIGVGSVTLAASAGRTVSAAYAGYATDDTAAFVACIAYGVSSGIRAILIPPRAFCISSELLIPSAFTFVGQSLARTILIHRPTAAGNCVRVSAGAAISSYNTVGNFAVYSDDTVWTKVALNIQDVSVFDLPGIRVYGQRSGLAPYYSGGTGSIGIKTQGREASGLKRVTIFADRPILLSTNPNTARTDGEDIDHFSGEDFYLLGNGFYCIEAEAGIGVVSLDLGGYQAWVGGTGGIKIADTRAVAAIVTRSIRIANVRSEQCSDPNGYLVNISATVAILSVELNNVFAASGMQGVKLVNVLRLVLDGVITATAAGKDCLNVSGATGGSVISMRACNWQLSSTFTVTGYTATWIGAFNSTLYAGPSDATYVNVITGTAVNVGTVTANVAASTIGLVAQATSSGDVFAVLPAAAGSGWTMRSLNNARSDFTPANFNASTYDFRYRTGVGTTASAAQVDTNGNLVAQKDLRVGIVGQGLYVKEGSNATMGRATLVAGTVVVSTTKVTANSEVFLTHQNAGGTPGFLTVSARTAGTSFTITSSNAGDTSIIAWFIVEPA